MTPDSDAARVLALWNNIDEAVRPFALEALERYATRSGDGGPLHWLLGIHYTDVQPGAASCYLDVSAALHNPGAVAHGAIAYALIDSAMGAALFHALDRPLNCTTIELKVNYLRPVTAGRLYATADVVERTRRFALMSGRVVDEQERLIAQAQGTFAILEPR